MRALQMPADHFQAAYPAAILSGDVLLTGVNFQAAYPAAITA